MSSDIRRGASLTGVLSPLRRSLAEMLRPTSVIIQHFFVTQQNVSETSFPSAAKEVEYLHLSPGMEVVRGPGAHERQLQVCVRVDAPGDHQLIGCIDDLHSRRDVKIQTNVNNFPIFNIDVADHRAVLVDNFASFDQDPSGLHSCCFALLRIVCWKE